MYKRYDTTDREEYYEQFTFPKKISQFQQWQNDLDKAIILNSGTNLKFRNIAFGSSKKKVYEINGRPRFLRQGGMFGEKKHEIAFYKELLDDNKLISQLHFIDDLFFYGCYTFRYLSRENFSPVKNLLLQKYGLENKVTGDPFVLIDDMNNQLRFVDNVFLNLIYLSGDNKIKTLFEEYSNEYKSIKKKNQKSFLMELYSLL